MDTRLVFAVLLVTLCWFSVGTYAQDNTTASATTNATTASATAATNATTASATAATNATTASTTAATNATTASATAATNATASATAATNATTASATAATNATTASATNATTVSGNSTTNVTAPLTPNITVEALQTNLSRTGCGSEFLCASEPSSCDPSGSGCFFFSAKQQSGDNFDLALAGESDGYVAATLSSDSTLGGNDTTYVCANDNGTVKFIPAVLDNDQLTNVSELNVNTVRGKIIGNIIQCTFAATVPSSSARSTSLTLAISAGSFNSTSGQLGAPTNKLRSSSVNLANASATVTNELSNTTSSAITFKQSLTQALLISAGMMGLTLL